MQSLRQFLEASLGGALFVVSSALIFWPLEEIFERDTSIRPKLKDIAYLWFYQSHGLWIAAGIVFESAFLLRQLLPIAWLNFVHEQPLWLQGCAGLVAAEIWGYVAHRLSHQSAFLWKFHQVHHTVEEMSWSASSRQHPVDFLFIIVGANLPAMVLGIDLKSIGLIVILERFYTVLLHTNLAFDWGWLSKVIASPSLHRAHHLPSGHRHNYAGILSLLDVLANTYEAPASTPSTSIGQRNLSPMPAVASYGSGQNDGPGAP
jgi:sterol desaturase/sphingolipid hydroxylase (fatty acid hydroxylase superfamily)